LGSSSLQIRAGKLKFAAGVSPLPPARVTLNNVNAKSNAKPVTAEISVRMSTLRQSFGIEALDRHLGAGLLPGTLTLVAGATGVGKTQLGLAWADAGGSAEGRRGVVCDLTSRGDSQNHAPYASRLFGWELLEYSLERTTDPAGAWDFTRAIGDYLHPVDRGGRRVTRADVDPDQWHDWKVNLARVLRTSAGFFYQHLARGTRRVVFDGLEPAERFSESIQFEYLEYIYHQVLRKDDDWAAREWLRERYQANSQAVMRHRYDQRTIGCVCLYTTPQVLLDELLSSPISQGDLFATANTIILLGRTRHDGRLGRALAVAKHRGSACGDEILPYRITDQGLAFG
jgi:KaiC/GvpD/RAD55 family RecA-like ATPase